MKIITKTNKNNGLPNPDFNKYLKHSVEPSKLSTGETDDLYKILKEQLEIHQGFGLAANQLGIDKRVCLIHIEDVELFLVNPVITYQSTDGIVFYESCLSLPKTMIKPVKTIRSTKIKVKTDNLGELTFEVNKEADRDSKEEKVSIETMQTIIVQHEIDHLNGITILERRHNQPTTKTQKFSRNDKIIMKSPTGDIVEVKYKKSNDFYLKGYEVI